MEPKEVPKMVEMAENHISTTVELGSLVLRENSTDCTNARSEMNKSFDCSPVNALKHASQPCNRTSTAQNVAVQVTENNKAEETVSAEANSRKTGANEAAHKMKITDQARLDTNNSPTYDAGNDQVTVEQSRQSLLESAGSMKPPAASSATASESLTKPVSVVVIDVKSPMRANTTTKASVDVKSDSSAPTPAPVPSMACMIMRTDDGPTAVDDSIQKLRAPLAETYAPYIHPSDTSLKDARDRLHKALEQTRQLRESFTDRVYKKYRVCLRPVPKSIDAIINPIVADPAAVSRKLEEDIHQIKEEKEIEKKEAQKLATLKAPVGPDGAPLAHAIASTTETAEQLAFITSGLSLVILPEDDGEENQADLSDYKYRGPFNLETGQRVGGISAAAAAAAEALLDRVRRGAAMRIERQRRRQLRLLAGETPELDTTSIVFPSSLHLLSSSDPARRIPERTTPSTKATKALHGTRVSLPFPSSSGSKSNRASLSSGALLSLNTSSEDLKSDGKPCAATAALISRGVGVTRPIQQRWRHPHPESLGGRGVMLGTVTSDKKCYASDPFDTSVGEPTIPEYITRSLPPLRNQKSWTQVKAVKVLDVQLAGTDRARTAVQAVLGQFLEPGEPLALCKKAAIESIADERNDTSKEGAPTVTGVSGEMPCVEADTAKTSLKDLYTNAGSCYDERSETSTTDAPMVTVGTDASGESLSAAADATDASQINAACNVTSSLNKRRKRCATEIDLLHAMQYTPEQEAKQMTETQIAKASASREEGAEVASDEVTDRLASSSTRHSPEDAEVAALCIQPMLAFSVMHALGLVKEAGLEKVDEGTESRLSRIDASAVQDKVEDKDMIADNTDKANLNDLMRKISSRKRSFTDMFLSDALLQVRASNSVGTASFSRSRDRMDGKETSGENFATKSRRDHKDEQSGNEIRPATSRTKECPVLAIRGGGEEAVEGSDDGIRKKEEVAKPSRRLHRQDRVDSDGARAKAERSSTTGSPDLRPSGSPMSPSAHESSLHNQAMLVDLAQQQLSLLHPQHRVNGSDVLYAPDYSPPRSSASPALSSIDRNAALRHQYANLHDSSAHALQLAHNTLAMNRLSASHAHQFSGDFSDYFGVQLPTHHASGYGSHADWSSLSTASAAVAGCLPAHSTLASIGLDPHLGLSVRDRARVLLAREQEHNAAVVAHAAAARRHASTVQAAAFISASQGDLYAHSASASSHFLHVGGHPAPPVDSALTSAFVGSPGRRTAKSKKPSKKESRTISSTGRQQKPAPKTSPSRRFLLKGQSGAEGAESSEDRNVGAEPLDQKSKSEKYRSRKSATNAPGSPEASVKVSSEKEDSSSTLELDRKSGVCRGVGDTTVAATSEKLTGKQTPEQKIPSEAPTETNVSELGLVSAEEPSSTPLATSGMQFFLPIAPAELSDEVSNLIVTARFHVALVDATSSLEGSTLIEYLLAVGGAVPIPKALISNPLKERLNTPGFKSQSNNAAPSVPKDVRCSNSTAPSVPREVVVATILVWLWAQNKTSFQRAFAKSGRIDVDPECKWLIHTAVDASVRALMLDIADAVARGGSMASALGGGRNKGSTNAEKVGGQVSASESDRQSGSSTSVDIHVASIVSQALMAQFCIDEGVDEALPYYSDLVRLLDEARLCALRTKCRERALVAALISRNATMSEQFSHAYVSAMVRAGEALGHEELFEQVQDEDTLTSTMIPYDIFTDESGAWEDPCRAKDEFAANLTGDDLMRRAHARAMIQKSLKKLQDRHSIRGGAPVAGPYADPPPDSNASGAGPAAGVERPQYQRTPSDSLKRKASFCESSFDRSTGVTVSTSMALYNPRHYSAPLSWDTDNVENTPYGKHMKGFRQRSFSLGRLSFREDADDRESTGQSKKRLRISRADSMSISCPPTDVDSLSLPRSTQEVAWVDVAQIFKPVALAGPTTPTARLGDDEEPETSARAIIAPFCRKVECPPVMSDDEGLGEEEDISDEAVLARHRVVLDRMKQKLDKVMEARQLGQQRDRNRSSSGI